jgi:hypothetical protein
VLKGIIEHGNLRIGILFMQFFKSEESVFANATAKGFPELVGDDFRLISNFGRGGIGGNELESAAFSTVTAGKKDGMMGCEVLEKKKGMRGFSTSAKFQVSNDDGFSVSPGGGMKDFSVESEMAKGKDQV